jgi:hypothetical protein
VQHGLHVVALTGVFCVEELDPAADKRLKDTHDEGVRMRGDLIHVQDVKKGDLIRMHTVKR